MGAQLENLSRAASLFSAVVPRLRGPTRDAEAPPLGAAQLHGATVTCVCDDQGVVLQISPNAQTVLGHACERAAEFRVALGGLLQPEDLVDVDGLVGQLRRTAPGESFTTELLTRSPSGAPRWLEIWCRNLHNEATIAAHLLEIRDITLRHIDLQHRALLSSGLHQLAESVIVTDLAGVIRYVNPAFEQQTGYRATEVIGCTPALLKSGRHRAEFFETLWRTITQGQAYRGEVCNRRKNGEVYHEEVLITPIRDPQGVISHFVSSSRNITEQKHADAQIEDRAFFDPLTGEASARLMKERAAQILPLARRHGHSSAMLHFHINGLHALSEQLGRTIVEEVLRRVAERLRNRLRESDSLARLDSDEYVVLLSEVSEENATARVVRRLRESVCKPYQIQEHTISVSVTVGVALYPQDAAGYDELLDHAHRAAVRARTLRTSVEFYTRGLTELTNDRLTLEEDLRWAWDRKQFVLHYQPIAELGTGDAVGSEPLACGPVIGLEALARWPHLERGMLEPAQFLPVVERTGRVVALDRWALDSAARQAAAWSSNGWRGWVSVNLSARSLHDADLVAYLKTCMQQHGVEPGRLVLEITEIAATRDIDVTARILRELRESGVLIALDGFGLGNTSIAHLKHFPVDILKLDPSFVHDIGQDPKFEQLIEVIITLAHRLGARIVAEGVEEQSQLDWLRKAGCDYVQGYFIGRPEAAEVIGQL
jgi:PAS domain S-box-containing protein/diguanylate cyclase (GGDEF)-like protein